MQIGVSNPNVPIFPPRVCTLVLFIIIVLQILLWLATLYTISKLSRFLFLVALLLAFEKLLISAFQFEKANSRMLHCGPGLLQTALTPVAHTHTYSVTGIKQQQQRV